MAFELPLSRVDWVLNKGARTLTTISQSLNAYLDDRAHPGTPRTMAQDTTTVSGNVEAVNDNGFRINGNWINYSQYGYHGSKYDPKTPTPSVGQFVTAELTRGKFINNLTIGNAVANATTPQATPTPPAQATHNVEVARIAADSQAIASADNRFIQTSIDTRLSILKTMAVAQPGMFADLDKVETLTEMVRSLETFVLEELTAATTPTVEDDDPDAEDLADDI